MGQSGYIAILIGIMIVTGVIGGFVNYSLALADDKKEGQGIGLAPQDPRLLWRSMITGVVAAFIVPLFLRLSAGGTDDLITSVLRTDCTGDSAQACANRAADFFVVAAFCLVAAVSARAFIQTISDRVLQQAREATRRAEAAEEKVERAAEQVEEMTEGLSEGEVDADAAVAEAAQPGPELDPDSVKLMIAMNDSTFYRRSTSGLVSETKIARPAALRLLANLAEKGLVEKATSKKDGTPRWRITSSGRTLVLRERLRD